MNARTKAFLARFAFCLALLLILTGIYYWQQFRTADSAVNAQAQTSLSVLSGSLDHHLSEAELSLQRFAASAPLRNFIKTAEAETDAKALDQNVSGFGLPGAIPGGGGVFPAERRTASFQRVRNRPKKYAVGG